MTFMERHWYPAYGHPDGWSDVPWFVESDGFGYRTARHPSGASQSPSFRVVRDHAYPTFGFPDDTVLTFEIIGSFAYTDAPGPWFQIR